MYYTCIILCVLYLRFIDITMTIKWDIIAIILFAEQRECCRSICIYGEAQTDSYTDKQQSY